ncbi:hypothetical protein MMC27_001372 [Xylographa pallens]|nr:hypothetical protein [Xylographa pallens]
MEIDEGEIQKFESDILYRRGSKTKSRIPIKLNVALLQCSRRLSRVSKAVSIPKFLIQPENPVIWVHLIETLTLNFQFDDARYDGAPIDSRLFIFALEILVKPSSNRLKVLIHDGCLYQEILDRIAVLPNLKRLHIRRTIAIYGCASYEDAEHAEDGEEDGVSEEDEDGEEDEDSEEEDWPEVRTDTTLDFTSCAQLNSLRTLEIGQIVAAEGQSLALAVSKLLSLEYLSLTAARGDRYDPLFRNEATRAPLREVSPLNAFIESILPISVDSDGVSSWSTKPLDLPASLRRLSLTDRFKSNLTIPTTPVSDHLLQPPALTDLHLDFRTNKCVALLLGIFMSKTVARLSIPRNTRANSLNGFQTRSRKIIKCYEKSIRQITFLDALHSKYEDLPSPRSYPSGTATLRAERSMVNGLTLVTPISRGMEWLWQNKFTAWQLQVNAPTAGQLNFNPREVNMLSSSLRWQYLNDPDRASWGKDLRHIRIDYLRLSNLLVDRLDSEEFRLHELRVLVVRERVIHDEGSSYCPSRPFQHARFGPPLSEDMESCTEGRIAKQLAYQYMPNLRLIAIGDYRFWVQRDDPVNILWYLRTALMDASQEEVMKATLDQKDWDFLSDNPDPLADIDNEECERLASIVWYRLD